MWVGVLLVLASLIVGARVLGAADDTVAVWRLDHDASAGSPLTAADVHSTRVHFGDAADGRRYLSAAGSLPSGVRLTRDVGAGELLAVSAVTTSPADVPVQLPLGVSAAGLPAGLAVGDRVDVWAVPSADSTRRRAPPVEVLREATVTAVGGAGLGGLGADRQVLVALSAGTDVGRALAALDGASVVLVENGS
jgi:hypothetical protein